jgi:hypothetical protein
MRFRPLGIGVVLIILSMTAGCCCWRPFHGCHHCCYMSAAQEAPCPAVPAVPAAGVPAR